MAVSGSAFAVALGVLAPDGAEDAQQSWEATRAHLARTLGEPVDLRTYDLPALREAIAAGRVDFFIANSGFYVEMEVSHGASRIATLDTPPALGPTKALASAVVVRADRADLRELRDLRNRRVATAGVDGFGGWQVAWGTLREAGIDPARDFTAIDVTGFPMRQVLERVMAGTSDAGVVRACLLEVLVRRGAVAEGALRVLNAQDRDPFPCARSTPLYPDWPFATVRHVDPELAKRVATALLAMPRTSEGTAWTIPTDYRGVHALLQELGIGPYSRIRENPSLSDVARRYWWVVTLAALLAAGGLLHNLRVEWMVKRRTRELNASLAAQSRLLAEAQAQQEKVDHLARLGVLGEMASMIAHELNQPLATIGNYGRGIARMLKAGHSDPDQLAEAANDIASEAERAAGVLARIRGFARKRPAERRALDLSALAQECVTMFRGMLPHAPRVEVIAAAAPVHADALQLQQVVLNLLKNAYDATRSLPAGEARITVDCDKDEDQVRLVVRDNGPGLGDEARGRLFEPFFTTKADGLGLGLAISLRVVEAHGGRLFAEPVPTGGLAVGFTLPQASKPQEP